MQYFAIARFGVFDSGSSNSIARDSSVACVCVIYNPRRRLLALYITAQ